VKNVSRRGRAAKSRRSRRGVGRRLATARRYRPLYAFFEKRQEDGGPSNGVPERKKRLKTRRLDKMKRIKRKNPMKPAGCTHAHPQTVNKVVFSSRREENTLYFFKYTYKNCGFFLDAL